MRFVSLLTGEVFDKKDLSQIYSEHCDLFPEMDDYSVLEKLVVLKSNGEIDYNTTAAGENRSNYSTRKQIGGTEMAARITDRNDWFEIWFEDRESILSTMMRNMGADLEAGYNYFGQSITKQRQEIQKYKDETDHTLDMFKDMDEKAVNRWCFYELKKHGAIE